jgi:HAD superfamily hydrolase (TIGR01509 family)
MDGVLVDSEPLGDEFTVAFLKKYGVQEGTFDLEGLRGMNAKSFYTQVVQKLKIGQSVEEIIAEAHQDYFVYLESVPNLSPVPGVVDLITRLIKAGVNLALGSSAHRKRVDVFLEKLHLSEFFSIRATGDDVLNGKPAPDIFLLAAEKMRIPPSRCVVIEDTLYGIQAAKAAGMRCIGFAGLPHNRQDLSGADIVIKDFSEIDERTLERLYG